MNRTPLPAGSLTSLEAALAALLDGLEPVAPERVPPGQALGRIAAAMPPMQSALPPRSIAVTDGWACRSLELVGAAAYSPLALASAPAWVEVGEAMPEGCDCVLEAGLVDRSGPIAQVVGEAAPGQGVRRTGEDLAAGSTLTIEGKRLGAADLLLARKAGCTELAVRSPRVCVIDVAAIGGEDFSTLLIAESIGARGARVARNAAARDATSIAAALDGDESDLIVLVGGTGDGRADATTEALARRDALNAHRVALRPGRTTAFGRLGATPVVALPGSPDQALGGFLALVQPVLDRLSARAERRPIVLPLARKIASTVGVTEIVLLVEEQGAWMPLAVGEFSLDTMRLADAWLAVPADSEGHAAGTPVGALPLHDAS